MDVAMNRVLPALLDIVEKNILQRFRFGILSLWAYNLVKQVMLPILACIFCITNNLKLAST